MTMRLLAATTFSSETMRWVLYGGLGLLGFWVVLRVFLRLTSLFVKLICLAGLLVVVVWFLIQYRH